MIFEILIEMAIIQRLVRGVSSSIGLASEAIAHNKDKKEVERQKSEIERKEHAQSRIQGADFQSAAQHEKEDEECPESDGDVRKRFDNDDEDWALDEAAAELKGPLPNYADLTPSHITTEVDVDPVDELVVLFQQSHRDIFLADMEAETPRRPLPCPVILPQRRPKQKSRGFVRAYAPLLGECAGIDQSTFIDFLDTFDKSSQASPALTVINLAASAAGLVPSAIAMAVSISVQIAARTAIEVQSRYRGNTFLDQVNESLFKPKGLYCLIMTFKPDYEVGPLNIDMSQDMALAKAVSVPETKMGQRVRKLKVSSGKTVGELALPEAAPLVYPAIDQAAAHAAEGNETTKHENKSNKLKSSAAFIADYLDRTAQAEYAGQHSGSKLSVPADPNKPFASRFADPNHPVNSGSIVSLLTGGTVDPKARRRRRRVERNITVRGEKPLTEEEKMNGGIGRGARKGGNRKRRSRDGLVKRLLGQNVLYLMIVNLPSETELREAS